MSGGSCDGGGSSGDADACWDVNDDGGGCRGLRWIVVGCVMVVQSGRELSRTKCGAVVSSRVVLEAGRSRRGKG